MTERGKRGRRTPYTARGISRVPCARCGAPSRFQWQICADDRVFRGVCADCDIGINETVLKYVRLPGWRAKLAAYRRRVAASLNPEIP